jgi:hypothetical protein
LATRLGVRCGACILPMPPDGIAQEDGVTTQEPIFSVVDRWGDEIVLTHEDWERIVSKRPDVAPYVEEVRETLEGPTRGDPGIVFEGRYPDTKAFFRRGLFDENHLFKACYVCVLVRYLPGAPASLRTVYFPINVQGAFGNVLYLER